MIIRCERLKTKLNGWTVDKVTEDGGYNRVRIWYELYDTSDPDDPIMGNAFRNRKDAETWAKKHPLR